MNAPHVSDSEIEVEIAASPRGSRRHRRIWMLALAAWGAVAIGAGLAWWWAPDPSWACEPLDESSCDSSVPLDLDGLPDRKLFEVALSPDGSMLAAAFMPTFEEDYDDPDPARSNIIVVFDTTTGERLHVLLADDETVRTNSLSFAPSGTRFAVSTSQWIDHEQHNKVMVFDAATGGLVNEMYGQCWLAVALSVDGSQVQCGERILDVGDGELIKHIPDKKAGLLEVLVRRSLDWSQVGLSADYDFLTGILYLKDEGKGIEREIVMFDDPSMAGLLTNISYDIDRNRLAVLTSRSYGRSAWKPKRSQPLGTMSTVDVATGEMLSQVVFPEGAGQVSVARSTGDIVVVDRTMQMFVFRNDGDW